MGDTETPMFFSGRLVNIHDATIQTLDRYFTTDHLGRPLMYPSEIYEKAMQYMDGADIVFAPEHPDFKLYDQDPDEAVKQAKGRFVGKLRGPYIDRTGHPKVRAKLEINNDPELEQMIREGKLSISPSLGVIQDENGNVKNIRFQNLLLFPEEAGSAQIPGDLGTGILNTQKIESSNYQNSKNQNPATATGTSMADGTGGTGSGSNGQGGDATPSTAEIMQQFTAMKQNQERLERMIKEKDDTINRQASLIEQNQQFQKDMDWKALADSLPKGLTQGEQYDISRHEFDENPAQFCKKVIDIIQKDVTVKVQEQGQQFMKEMQIDPAWEKGKEMFQKLGLTAQDFVGNK